MVVITVKDRRQIDGDIELLDVLSSNLHDSDVAGTQQLQSLVCDEQLAAAADSAESSPLLLSS